MANNLFNNFNFLLLDSPEFKEDSVREEIILPLLKKLGYSSSGPYKIRRSITLTHPFVKIGSGKREIKNFPDYLLQVNDKYAWVLDAKNPHEEIKTGENVEQVYFYSIYPDIRVNFYALCNGKEFIVFKIDEKEALLHFYISEIEKFWHKLEELLGPANFIEKKKIKKDEREEITFNYLTKKILSEIPAKKQAAKRHFGVHGYFTKQSWNVVQEYIKNFTKPGDIILDPFGGGGVTLIEALMTNRKAINIDINPLSIFIVKNLVEPISLNNLQREYEKLKNTFLKYCPKSKFEIKKALIKYPYPKNIILPKGSDVKSIEKLFNQKQLAQLAFLKHLIKNIKEKSLRNSLLLAFSSTLTKINLTYHPSKSRGENAGNCAAFQYYRYRIAPKPVELDVLKTFEIKFKRLIAAKKELSAVINKKILEDSFIYKGTATKLDLIADESIDYIYTDPPYGSKIPYLDLSIMWNGWLDLSVTEYEYKEEAIEGGEHKKTKGEYSEILSKSIQEMFRVLKFNRWMSFVFAHKDPSYWHLIVETAEKAGFEYSGAVKQLSGQSSFKKRQNPFTVLWGQLIINFKKVKNPKTIMKLSLGVKITDIIIETIEATIAANDGATLEQINDELIIKGLELGFLDILSKEYSDLTPLLLDNFDYDIENKNYQLRKNKTFKTNIDVELRIRYFLISYMRRKKHENYYPTFDEIILYIMPLLKNGITPENQTILKVLESIAERTGIDGWKLKKTGQLNIL